jgi:predicted nucleic acid-binding Zn ribbon protein
MRNKKLFLFDEMKEAKHLYTKGFPDGNINYSEMYLVAKFIRDEFSYGEIRLEKAIINFCQTYNKNFNPVTEAYHVKKWVKSAMNYGLRKIDSVPISINEIKILREISNSKHRKLLFVTLIFSKALKKGNTRRGKEKRKRSNKYYIHYNNFSDIIRLAGINNMNDVALADIFHDYSQYFTFYNPERELLRLEYVDKFPDEDSTLVATDRIEDYYNIIFEKYFPVSHCAICGKEIIKNSNIQKYCKECAKIRSKEQHRELMRKRRAQDE